MMTSKLQQPTTFVFIAILFAIVSNLLIANTQTTETSLVPSSENKENNANAYDGMTSKAKAFGSYLSINSQKLFKIQSGCSRSSTPDIILLSGPTDHWHSDSGWYALLQPLLSKSYCVWSVDRAGHGFSPSSERMSYVGFGQQLNQIAVKNKWKNVIVVAFASSNISLHTAVNDSTYSGWVSGALLIDPDVLLPHSIAQYSSDAKPFRDNLEKYRAYITEGKYAKRAAEIAEKERNHIKQILPEKYQKAMDWAYYTAIANQRQTIDRLIARFTEISGYQDDLQYAAQLSLPKELPLVIINTDFESSFIEATRKNKKQHSDTDPSLGLAKWRKEGNQWMKTLAEGNHRKYTPIKSREHLLLIANPDLIIESVQWLRRYIDQQ